VRDAQTGEPLAGATVALADWSRVATVDAGGRYALGDVPSGSHRLTIRFIGYVPRSLRALVPEDGTLEIDVSLRAQPVRLQTVEVSAVSDGAPASLLGRGPPDRAATTETLWMHPLLAEPDLFQAIEGGDVAVRPESPSGIHIRGGLSDQTAYLLDGVPVFSPYHAGGVFSAWNADALADVQVLSSTPPPEYVSALSGTLAGETRTPGTRLQTRGGISTTQARLTVDGPLGFGSVGVLVSVRSSSPALVAPRGEGSYVRGDGGDRLATIEAPAFGGRLRLLGYDNENELDAAAGAGGRNAFAWQSTSLGADWHGAFSGTLVRVLGWRASGAAGSRWSSLIAPVELRWSRDDAGLLATVERGSDRAATAAGVRFETNRTSYQIRADSEAKPSWALAGSTPLATAFARHTRTIGRGFAVALGASAAVARGRAHLAPTAQLSWSRAEWLQLSGSYARSHQFAQSLRNPESVVGSVFPVDLYVGAGAPGIPVAHSDQGVIAVALRPSALLSLGLRAYARRSDGLVLVAPHEGEPFATTAITVGSSSARGAALDVALQAPRYGVFLRYGLQRVRLRSGPTSYAPDVEAAQMLDGGVTVLPTPGSSIRVGVSGAFGRRTTAVSSGFEWEACNLLDRGCELAGSPHYAGEVPGGTTLPAYLRVDLGFRKDWRMRWSGREMTIAMFGTVTNAFGRKNVLTYTRDPGTGKLAAVTMRPLAPLVLGIDWRF
jgi:hypothetical protein